MKSKQECKETVEALGRLAEIIGKSSKLETEQLFAVTKWKELTVLTTKEVAKALGISTRSAYKLLCKELDKGTVFKYGYWVNGGWDDPDHTNRKCDSLGWQRNA